MRRCLNNMSHIFVRFHNYLFKRKGRRQKTTQYIKKCSWLTHSLWLLTFPRFRKPYFLASLSASCLSPSICTVHRFEYSSVHKAVRKVKEAKTQENRRNFRPHLSMIIHQQIPSSNAETLRWANKFRGCEATKEELSESRGQHHGKTVFPSVEWRILGPRVALPCQKMGKCDCVVLNSGGN